MNNDIKEGQWITIKSENNPIGIDAYILKVISKEKLYIGYYQNEFKAIGENVIWNGEYWEFEHPGVSGIYLRGREENIVKKGPYRI